MVRAIFCFGIELEGGQHVLLPTFAVGASLLLTSKGYGRLHFAQTQEELGATNLLGILHANQFLKLLELQVRVGHVRGNSFRRAKLVQAC